MTTIAPVNRSLRVVPLRVRPGPTPRPSGRRGAGPEGEVFSRRSTCVRARRSEPSKIRPMSLRSDRLNVDGLGALVALLGVVGHLRALLQRAITLADDAGVMDEQVLVTVIGGDETEPLVV